jgi:hypothetical protein
MVDAFTKELTLAAHIASGHPGERFLDGSLAADALTICQAIARATVSRQSESVA